jgi:hypothetical protein
MGLATAVNRVRKSVRQVNRLVELLKCFRSERHVKSVRMNTYSVKPEMPLPRPL